MKRIFFYTGQNESIRSTTLDCQALAFPSFKLGDNEQTNEGLQLCEYLRKTIWLLDRWEDIFKTAI